MGEYNPALICVATSDILIHSATVTQTKEAMKRAGFKQVSIKYDTYQKRIEIMRKKIVASNSSQIIFSDRVQDSNEEQEF